MKLRDEVKDWIMPAFLLTPHVILLTSIWVQSSHSIELLQHLFSIIGNIATFAGVFIAVFAFNTWKHSLQAQWDRDTKLTIGPQLYETAQKIHELMGHYNHIENYIQTIRKIEFKNSWQHLPPPPPEIDSNIRSSLLNSSLEKLVITGSASQKMIDRAKELDLRLFDFAKPYREIMKNIEVLHSSGILHSTSKEEILTAIPEFNIEGIAKKYSDLNKSLVELLKISPTA